MGEQAGGPAGSLPPSSWGRASLLRAHLAAGSVLGAALASACRSLVASPPRPRGALLAPPQQRGRPLTALAPKATAFLWSHLKQEAARCGCVEATWAPAPGHVHPGRCQPQMENKTRLRSVPSAGRWGAVTLAGQTHVPSEGTGQRLHCCAAGSACFVHVGHLVLILCQRIFYHVPGSWGRRCEDTVAQMGTRQVTPAPAHGQQGAARRVKAAVCPGAVWLVTPTPRS